MNGERGILTPEMIAKAEKREGIAHPLVNLLDQHSTTLENLFGNQASHAVRAEEANSTRKDLGFLADEMVQATPFTLSATDIVAIWSRAMEIPNFLAHQGYTLARSVSCAYAVHGTENPEWRKFPRYHVETGRIPEDLMRDTNGLLHIKGRLDEVSENYQGLRPFLSDAAASSAVYRVWEHFGNGLGMVRIKVGKALATA